MKLISVEDKFYLLFEEPTKRADCNYCAVLNTCGKHNMLDEKNNLKCGLGCLIPQNQLIPWLQLTRDDEHRLH